MKILVTGGAGFIGSNIVDAYIEAGHQVVVVDDLSSGKMKNVNPRASCYLLDIRSAELESVFATEQFEVVNHHAAQKSVPASVEDPFLDADINILGILNLLQLSVQFGVKKFIFSSTGGALLGDAEEIPTPEDAEVKMISPYAISKYTSERYLDFYANTHGLDYTVLRYANVYGPRQIPEGECGVIPLFMDNLLNGKPSVLYAYSHMPAGCTRDYLYVGDVVQANLLALTKGERAVLNIGTGLEVSTAEVYELLQTATNRDDLVLKRAGERAGDVERSALDCFQARKILGWEPRVSLEEGLALTVAYFSQGKEQQ